MFNPPKEYPLSPRHRVELITAQGFLCAICGTKTALCVDHDHETNLVRGALCQNCNLGLGNFKDSQRLLLAALGYLQKAQMANEDENVSFVLERRFRNKEKQLAP